MKTLRKEKIEIKYVEHIPPKIEMEQRKIYVSKEYNGSSHLCLCGCGVECYLPLKEGEWTLSDENGKVTIIPSILQRFECESHYIITKGIANFI
jgi:hypothetical protein